MITVGSEATNMILWKWLWDNGIKNASMLVISNWIGNFYPIFEAYLG